MCLCDYRLHEGRVCVCLCSSWYPLKCPGYSRYLVNAQRVKAQYYGIFNGGASRSCWNNGKNWKRWKEGKDAGRWSCRWGVIAGWEECEALRYWGLGRCMGNWAVRWAGGESGGKEKNINLGTSQMLIVFGSGPGRDGLWEGPMSSFLTRPAPEALRSQTSARDDYLPDIPTWMSCCPPQIHHDPNPN